MFKKSLLSVFILLCISSFTMAEEANEKKEPNYQYLPLEPDIITNYIKPGKRVGFVRVKVELMVKSAENYALIDLHKPLIRDKIITILGMQDEKSAKSITEREAIRLSCLTKVNELLFTETGKKPLEDLIFTKYLYQ